MSNVTTLNVLLYGQQIGTITHVGGDRTLFAFTDAYIGDPERPLLSLGFKDAFGGLLTDFSPTQTRLLPWFSNLLPEGHLRKYLAERARVSEAREFFLLWVLGRDLPGAVTAVPADGEAWPPETNAEDDRPAERRRAHALRFSLAGVQLKFSALGGACGGLTIPLNGDGGDWIVKLPSPEFEGVPENEFSMMTLAQKIGMDVPPVRLVNIKAIENLPEGVNIKGDQAFVIQRFDRLRSGPVHIEDFAQIFGVYPDKKYKKATMQRIAQVIGAEGLDTDIAEFTRRLVFNALIGNADMHLKNWSLIYPNKRSAAIAPAYDFLSTTPYIKDEASALKFSRSARFDELSMDELAHMAGKARLPEKLVVDTARETVDLFHQHWRAEFKNLPLAKGVIEAVEHQLKIIPLVTEG